MYFSVDWLFEKLWICSGVHFSVWEWCLSINYNLEEGRFISVLISHRRWRSQWVRRSVQHLQLLGHSEWVSLSSPSSSFILRTTPPSSCCMSKHIKPVWKWITVVKTFIGTFFWCDITPVTVLRPGREGSVPGSHKTQPGLLQTPAAITTGQIIALLLCLAYTRIYSPYWCIITHYSILIPVTYLCFLSLFAPSSVQDGEKLADSILKSVLTLSTVYYWLPKSQGKKGW